MLLEQLKLKNPVLLNCSEKIKNQIIKALNDIKVSDSNNPENEILDDNGRILLKEILTM